MSHQPERKEKNCLNCGAEVAGRYCQVCGQENILPKQTAWGLITHFIYDLLHFDGKFFHTVGGLFRKPGLVPKEYVAGRRMRYLDPIRMYLFASAIFFLLFFSLQNPSSNAVKMDEDNARTMTKLERLQYASEIHQRLRSEGGDSLQRQLNFLLDTTVGIALRRPDSMTSDSTFRIRFNGRPYTMLAWHRKVLSDDSVSGDWLFRTLVTKWRTYKRSFADDDQALAKSAIDTLFHKFPYLLFVSLPFFALILKLLYVRRKSFLYSDHAVFTLYHYILTFLLLMVTLVFARLEDVTGWNVFDILATIVFLSGGVFLLLAMKRFYAQGWGRTFFKFILLNILALFTMFALLLVFILISVIQL